MAEMGLKREIALLIGVKGVKDLSHTTNNCLIDIHGLKG